MPYVRCRCWPLSDNTLSLATSEVSYLDGVPVRGQLDVTVVRDQVG